MRTTSVITSTQSHKVSASASGIPLDRILCVRTIQQTSKPSPPALSEVPSDAEEWVSCYVPADQFESAMSCWAELHCLPPIHLVGLASDHNYIVAVTASRIQSLRDLHLAFTLPSSPESERISFHNVLEASDAKRRVHGQWAARQKAQNGFLKDAVRGIYEHSRGLGRYYQRNTVDQSLLAPIKWAILIRDIEAAPPDILDRFLLSCLFIALHIVDDPCSESALELIKRDREAWKRYFQELGRTKTTWPAEYPEMEAHEISLFRAVFESAGGKLEPKQWCVNVERSVNDNITIMGNLFDVHTAESVSFDRWSAQKQKIWDLIVRSELFQYNEHDGLDAEGLRQQVLLHVPIGFSDETYDTLPAELVNALGRRTVMNGLHMIYEELYEMPWLKKKGNHLQLLLCHCIVSGVDDKSLLAWMASEKGKDEYGQIMICLRESQNADQTALCLTALLCYGISLDMTGEMLEPMYGSYLCDFFHHLNGNDLRNRRWMWEQMVCSFRNARNCHPNALGWLKSVDKAPRRWHWADMISDSYWRHRSEETHESALEKIQSELAEVVTPLMALGWEMV